MTVTIDETCTACGLCLLTCPPDALRPAPRRPAVVDARCTDCWLCIEVCPVDAIHPAIATHPADAIPPAEATPPAATRLAATTRPGRVIGVRVVGGTGAATGAAMTGGMEVGT